MVEVFDCAQNSQEWLRARMGIPTGSMFATVMAKGRDGESKTRRTYMLKLADEILNGEPMENYSNEHMERGHEMEPEARELYGFREAVEPQVVGFIRNGRKGCSPDSLIGDNGLLEIKTKFPHLLLECVIRGDFPPEHKAQCQGALWVAEREWIDLAVYWPKRPLFVVRAARDETYIKTLAGAVDAFNDELDAMVASVRTRHGIIRSKVAA